MAIEREAEGVEDLAGDGSARSRSLTPASSLTRAKNGSSFQISKP